MHQDDYVPSSPIQGEQNSPVEEARHQAQPEQSVRQPVRQPAQQQSVTQVWAPQAHAASVAMSEPQARKPRVQPRGSTSGEILRAPEIVYAVETSNERSQWRSAATELVQLGGIPPKEASVEMLLQMIADRKKEIINKELSPTVQRKPRAKTNSATIKKLSKKERDLASTRWRFVKMGGVAPDNATRGQLEKLIKKAKAAEATATAPQQPQQMQQLQEQKQRKRLSEPRERRRSDRARTAPRRFVESEEDEPVRKKRQSAPTSPESTESRADSTVSEDDMPITAKTPTFVVKMHKKGEIDHVHRDTLFSNGADGDQMCTWMKCWVNQHNKAVHLSEVENCLMSWVGMIKSITGIRKEAVIFPKRWSSACNSM